VAEPPKMISTELIFLPWMPTQFALDKLYGK
jgi:hypothetical protein